MYRQSPRSRGQRSNKGFKIKHGLLLIFGLGVGIWLLYQTQRSYDHKDKSVGQDGNNPSERSRLGRKDLPDLGDTQTLTHENDGVKFGGNEQTNVTVFSDETFVSHSQNEMDDNLGDKSVKGETGADLYQSDLNGDPNSVEGGDSTAFSDTNGHKEANVLDNTSTSTVGTNEKSESQHVDTFHNSSSQPLVMINSGTWREISSNMVDSVKQQQHEQVESSNKVSEGKKEDANVVEHHDETDSSVSEEANERNDLNMTLLEFGNQTHSEDVAAL